MVARESCFSSRFLEAAVQNPPTAAGFKTSDCRGLLHNRHWRTIGVCPFLVRWQSRPNKKTFRASRRAACRIVTERAHEGISLDTQPAPSRWPSTKRGTSSPNLASDAHLRRQESRVCRRPSASLAADAEVSRRRRAADQSVLLPGARPGLNPPGSHAIEAAQSGKVDLPGRTAVQPQMQARPSPAMSRCHWACAMRRRIRARACSNSGNCFLG